QLFCSCAIPRIYLGIQTGFWEPVRRVDVTRTPYCMVSLGTELDVGVEAPEGEVRLHDDNNRHSFYQAHWYTDPIMMWLEVIYEHPCTETGYFDIGYMTELDPMWNDDELSAILSPEAALFTNPLTQAA
ncbi:TraU family protein, partial [Acinetobacter baumannii]